MLHAPGEPDAPETDDGLSFSRGDGGDLSGFIRDAVRLLEPLVAGAPLGFAVVDAGMRFLHVNEALARMNYRPVADHLGRTVRETLGAEAGAALEPRIRQAFGGTALTEQEISGTPASAPDHGLRHYRAAYYPLRPAPDGPVVAVGILVHDVTVRVRQETRLREQERFLRLATETARLGLWEYDPATGGLEGTDRCQEILATPGQTIARYEDWLQRVYEDDRDRVHDAVQCALDPCGSGEYASEYRVASPEGAVRFISATGSAEFTGEGDARRAVRLVGTLLDITDRKRAEERHRFLGDLVDRTRRMNDPQAIVWETVCAVGQLLRVSRYMYADVDTEAGTVTVHRDYCGGPGASSVAGVWPLAPWGKVVDDLAAGRTVINRDYATDPRTAGDYEGIYKQAGVRANVTVPLHRDGRWVAVFSAQMTDAPRDWGDDDVEFLETVAERMWLTLENARLYRALEATAARQTRIAETLQRSMLLTPEDRTFPRLAIATLYEAAWDEAQVGGDFHDAFALDEDRVALVVGDVTGKGLEAAAHTAEAKFALRAFLRESPNPAIALERLNNFLADGQQWDGRDAASLICLITATVNTRTGEAVCASAGAEQPLLLRATGQAEMIPVRGVMLGIQPQARFELASFRLESGDVLLFTTDGVTEARRRRREFFGAEGIARAWAECPPASQSGDTPEADLRERARAVADAARRFAGGKLQDDVCLLLARRL